MNAIRAEGASKIRGAIVFAIFLFIATCFFGRESRSDQRGVRTVNFSGAEWLVKSGYGGPGPNVWSDSEESVWVDDEGRLHMKIRKIGGQWHCAEVLTKNFARYGVYRFYLIGRIDQLDKNVVFAPFLYAKDHQEVDIEFAKWGQTDLLDGQGQYVVQPAPYKMNHNIVRFPIKLNGTHSTHTIDWWREGVAFTSIHGHFRTLPDANALIRGWNYRGGKHPRQEDNLRVHINLWLFNSDSEGRGDPPSDGKPVEVVIRSVELPHLTQ